MRKGIVHSSIPSLPLPCWFATHLGSVLSPSGGQPKKFRKPAISNVPPLPPARGVGWMGEWDGSMESSPLPPTPPNPSLTNVVAKDEPGQGRDVGNHVDEAFDGVAPCFHRAASAAASASSCVSVGLCCRGAPIGGGAGLLLRGHCCAALCSVGAVLWGGWVGWGVGGGVQSIILDLPAVRCCVCKGKACRPHAGLPVPAACLVLRGGKRTPKQSKERS